MTEQSDKSAMDQIRALMNPKDIKRAMACLSEGRPDGVTNDEFFKVYDAALVIHDDVLFQEATQYLETGPAYAALKALKEISNPGKFEKFGEFRAQAQQGYDSDLYTEAKSLSERNWAPARARWCLDEIENKAAFPDYDVLSTEIDKSCGRQPHKSAPRNPEP